VARALRAPSAFADIVMKSDLANRFIRQLHPAVPRPLPGEAAGLVLDHPQTRLSCRLNPSAAFLWSAMAEESRPAALAERLAAEFDIPRDQADRALSDFVYRMGALGFVRVDDASPPARLRGRYLDLLKAALTNILYAEHELRIERLEQEGAEADPRRMRDIRYLDPELFEELIAHKADGRVWRGKATRFSHTMIGVRRLQNLEWCAERIFDDGIEGDFLEAGVCQGGAAIFLRALQVAHGQEQRRTWVADSFQGLPKPTSEFDEGYELHEEAQPWLAASLTAVQDNFRTYDLLSDQVRFLPGWFADSLAGAPVESLAILRLDADLYSSTREVLDSLYDKVVPGGFIIIDDYHVFPNCRRAVDEFRAERSIADPLVRIDWTAVFWRRM
jgi:O-methyltransferase